MSVEASDSIVQGEKHPGPVREGECPSAIDREHPVAEHGGDGWAGQGSGVTAGGPEGDGRGGGVPEA